MGWIKLSRTIWDNPVLGDHKYLAVWIWLLTYACHGKVFVDGKYVYLSNEELPPVLFGGKTIRLQRGQLTCGAIEIADETNVPRSTVENILKRFVSEEMIEVQTCSQCSLITVKNWDKYQNDEEQNEERLRSKKGTDKDLYKNVKNDKNEKKAPEKKLTSEQYPSLEEQFKKVVLQHQWADEIYIEKTWDQRRLLSPKQRAEFDRKVTLMVTWARSAKYEEKARPIFHEIAGFVNDHGAMNRVLSPQERLTREEFHPENNGMDREN